MRKVIIHGHRGSRGTHTENTIVSFADAASAGAEFVELDVHLSRDQELIVFHDFVISNRLCRDSVGRAIQTPLLVSSLSLAEIQAFQCGKGNAQIPSLRELIEWKCAHAPRLKLNVEIKNDLEHDPSGTQAEILARAVIDLLRRYQLMDESLVQSFDFRVVGALRKLDSNLKLSCLFEHPADFAREALQNHAQVAAIHYPLITKNVVLACHDLGIEVLPWTVNDEQEWTRLIDLGVRSIITDFPKKLRDFLRG